MTQIAKEWANSTPVIITYTPRWWQFWKNAYSIQMSREDAQREYNKYLSALLEEVKCPKNQ